MIRLECRRFAVVEDLTFAPPGLPYIRLVFTRLPLHSQYLENDRACLYSQRFGNALFSTCHMASNAKNGYIKLLNNLTSGRYLKQRIVPLMHLCISGSFVCSLMPQIETNLGG